MQEWPDQIETLVSTRFDQLQALCHEQGVDRDYSAREVAQVRQTLLSSDYAFGVWQRHPVLLGSDGLAFLSSSTNARTRKVVIDAGSQTVQQAMHALRRFRHSESLRIIYRAVSGLSPLVQTLADTCALYETLADGALHFAEQNVAVRHGWVRAANGEKQQLVVLGLGKLGGMELNFSSDIDLILACPEPGASDGQRELDSDQYFLKVARLFIKLLSEPQVNGMAARVDLRLRPFGSAGKLVLSFASMEQYYQNEGRDWERYAWVKARPVAGNKKAGKDLLNLLRPFIYRRYLDYTAFAGLRDMKDRIDQEVARKDLSENIKLGPGGIREIEFIVQLMQLIRGGREPSLRTQNLMTALKAGRMRDFLHETQAQRLKKAYVFLRLLENRFQMLQDMQTHEAPEDDVARQRVALGLGYSSWQSLAKELVVQRQIVSHEFSTVLVPHGGYQATVPAMMQKLWQSSQQQTLQPEALIRAGFSDGAKVKQVLQQLSASLVLRDVPGRVQQCLNRLIPQLLDAALKTQAPDACIDRLTHLVQAVARRSAYLSLLEEQPGARKRLADVFADSAFLADKVIAQPLLLDDVLDPRTEQMPLARMDITAEIERVLAALEERDAGGELDRLNELKASLSFRLGLVFLDEKANGATTASRLAALAEAMVRAVMRLAERELALQHGYLPGEGLGFCVLGYGSLGGKSLGFASDIDLVFIYDGSRSRLNSDGKRPLEGVRWYQRLAQRIMHWLSTLTRAGRLYEVDTRLRPDGSTGLLVTSLDAFAHYQRTRAWTWEHQALLRARFVAGDPFLAKRFEQIRTEVLTHRKDSVKISRKVASMRARWRQGRDRSNPTHIDLKQGKGALLDIDFLLQGQVLIHAADYPQLLKVRSNPQWMKLCYQLGLFTEDQSQKLVQAHETLLARSLLCTLDARQRVARRDTLLESSVDRVLAVANSLGCMFE